jgi:hypothetical protein
VQSETSGVSLHILLRFAPETLAHRRDVRKACKILVENPEEEIGRGRSRRRFGDNIKLDLNESGLDLFHLGMY